MQGLSFFSTIYSAYEVSQSHLFYVLGYLLCYTLYHWAIPMNIYTGKSLYNRLEPTNVYVVKSFPLLER